MVFVGETRNTEFYDMCIRSSLNLHNEMIWKILRAPTLFFDTQPVGIVQTKFSTDMGIVDKYLPMALLDVMTVSLQ